MLRITPYLTNEKICHVCRGTGQIEVGTYTISHDMAIEADNEKIKGAIFDYEYRKCKMCNGQGVIEI